MICCRSDSRERPRERRCEKLTTDNDKKYLDLARELKRLWDMKVTVIPKVIVVVSTVTKRLIKDLEDLEIRGRVET